MARIFLIRHGRPEFQSGEKRCIGVTDVPLSVSGCDAMRVAADALPHVEVIYSSPLIRARESADILSRGRIPVKIVDGLHEIRMGVWEGLTFDEIRARYPDDYARRGEDIVDHAPEGGETFAQCRSRAMRTYEAILADSRGKDIALLAHAGINRALICTLENRPLASLFDIPQDYASIYEIGVGIVSSPGGR